MPLPEAWSSHADRVGGKGVLAQAQSAGPESKTLVSKWGGNREPHSYSVDIKETVIISGSKHYYCQGRDFSLGSPYFSSLRGTAAHELPRILQFD